MGKVSGQVFTQSEDDRMKMLAAAAAPATSADAPAADADAASIVIGGVVYTRCRNSETVPPVPLGLAPSTICGKSTADCSSAAGFPTGFVQPASEFRNSD